MRPYQVATAAVIILIAAVAMFDSRASALPDTTGTAPGGLGAGFYPFWSAFLVAAASAVVVYRTLSTPQPAEGPFAGRESVIAVTKLILPMLLATAAIVWLGFYLVTGLYMGFFARFIGRYRWLWTIVPAVAVPLVLYVVFELGFRVSLPKSVLYRSGLPF